MSLTKLPKQLGVDTALEFEDSEGRDIQGVVIADSEGNQTGIDENPLPTIPMPVSFGGVNNIAVDVGSTFVFDNMYGMSTIGFYLNISGGKVISEISFDGTNWEPASMRCMALDIITSTMTMEAHFIGSIAGARYWRLRVTEELSAPGTVVGRGDSDVSVIETIEFNAPPHKVGYIIDHHDNTFTTTQTGTALWTPASGKKIVLTQMTIIAWGVNDATVEIFQNGGGSGNRFFYADIDVSNNKQFILHLPYTPAVPLDTADSPLKVTTSAAISISIMVVGYEV